MEIILLLMALGATPFGAAMFDKHTRKRFKKFVKAAAANSILSKDGRGHMTMAEALKLQPRNKDWAADSALQVLWQDAFNYWSIRDRDTVMQRVANRFAEYNVQMDTLRGNLVSLEDEKKSDEYYHYSDYDYYYKERIHIEAEIADLSDRFSRSLGKDEKVALELVKRHGSEVYYGNDLIRLSAQKSLPSLDFVALTAYTSK